MKKIFLSRSVASLIFLLICVNVAVAQNPILKGYADPHMKIWNGKMYISVGQDKSPELKRFSMPSWAIYSSSDLMNWKHEKTITPGETFIGEGSDKCWASDISSFKGKYYFYFSHGGSECGVLEAEKPEGPYTDVLGKPLIAHDFSDNHEYDPTIFTDDDGQQYIIFGRDGQLQGHLIHYQIAKLSDDMVSLAEMPKDLMTDKRFGFGGETRARDHQYFHKHNGIYYLSCAGAYMTANSVYGPFENLRHTGQNGHSSFCEYNGQWYHMNEWTCEPHRVRQYRQVCMTYLHYKDNGDMVDDVNFLQKTSVAEEGKYYKTGVGNYDANWEKIESEWFFKKEGSLKKRECPAGGFEIQNIQNDDILCFPNIKNLESKNSISFSIANANKAGSIIEIREASKNGKLLAECVLPRFGSFEKYETASCKLGNLKGAKDLCFVFKGGKGELLRLDWFKLD